VGSSPTGGTLPTGLDSAVVIGAGLAGLVAADELVRHGWSVEVLEARDRVGGRTWSRQLPNGAVAEMGAEFILPGNTEIAALAEGLGLGLVDKGMRYGRREPRGVAVTDTELNASVATLEAALSRVDGDPSARVFLESLAIPGPAREVILARAEISSASSADQVPARDLKGIAHIDDEPSPGVAGGNQGLTLALADRLGDRVRLGDPVELVRWSVSGVTARTRSGRETEADRCVIAVPARVLERIAFEPELPPRKRDALARVRYGNAVKLFVSLSEPAPPGAVMNVHERWWCWTQTDAAGEPVRLVSCFAGSTAALDRLEVDHGPGLWLERLAELRPELALEPDGAVLSTWADDPWAGAAYSISSTPDQAAALAAPVGPLEFAGEHTGGPFSGLMEGAIRSGRRAAVTIAAGT
jgi:monoamine oxidase